MGISGIELFKKRFKDYTDCYTIIGGAACDILMNEAAVSFRATKDIDMIVLFEDKAEEFAITFWDFIREGNYLCGWRNDDKAHYYRFTDPSPGYPVQIELFSRKLNYHKNIDTGIIPIHISEDVSSLSAIIMNDDFYEFMLQGRIEINGLSILSTEYLIPFKMFAWLNLKEEKQSGKHVNKRDLKKHKNDVFRLLQIIDAGKRIKTKGLVKKTKDDFLNEIKNESVDTKALRLPFTKDEAVSIIQNLYY